jgi:hypothetical protein
LPPPPPPPSTCRYNLNVVSKVWCLFTLDRALWRFPSGWSPSDYVLQVGGLGG